MPILSKFTQFFSIFQGISFFENKGLGNSKTCRRGLDKNFSPGKISLLFVRVTRVLLPNFGNGVCAKKHGRPVSEMPSGPIFFVSLQDLDNQIRSPIPNFQQKFRVAKKSKGTEGNPSVPLFGLLPGGTKLTFFSK